MVRMLEESLTWIRTIGIQRARSAGYSGVPRQRGGIRKGGRGTIRIERSSNPTVLPQCGRYLGKVNVGVCVAGICAREIRRDCRTRRSTELPKDLDLRIVVGEIGSMVPWGVGLERVQYPPDSPHDM